MKVPQDQTPPRSATSGAFVGSTAVTVEPISRVGSSAPRASLAPVFRALRAPGPNAMRRRSRASLHADLLPRVASENARSTLERTHLVSLGARCLLSLCKDREDPETRHGNEKA
jgi:hypothetical protein